MIIKPHGGRLVSRILSDEEAINKLDDDSSSMPRITLNARELCDLEMIATGAMSPLEGFMTREDYDNVLERMRLKTGLPWSLPVVLSLKAGEADAVKEGSTGLKTGMTILFVIVVFVVTVSATIYLRSRSGKEA